MSSWPRSGRIDPFTSVYNLVFHLTIRTLGATELADDLVTVEKLAELFWNSENEFSFIHAVVPWIPSRAKKNRDKAISALYEIFADTINKRKAEQRSENDAVQLMLDQGDTVNEIAPFLMWAIFIGTNTTGIVVCWILMYLKTHPEWDAKVREEFQTLLNEYSTDSTVPMYARLSQIPLDAWEGSSPVMEAIITETVRMAMSVPTMRRNLGEDIEVNGLRVKRGDFMLYPMGAENLNPDNYPDPLKWDPARWADPTKLDRERSQWTYLGWGAGLHPCHGMRGAKLHLKITTALFLPSFEYSRVDKNDNTFHSIPEINYSDARRFSPKGEGRYLHYKKTAGI
ncbi:hypothetical protein SERLA73DRAFT_111015 [Serpula lacrymans var. lacrymans S7.3]|uniref:Cytochrome P450 n=2 Tax=Serpula lacrymans var. lacrymans TaxID=341189 RepID=F8Q3D5_SERL3|nr:hypothetical protein SERLA73DRAFT_111015 [Serpula lacrymans var. lacrymans S7.3]